LLLPSVHGYWIPRFPFLQTCVAPASHVSNISGQADVRYSPKADIDGRNWDVRFVPKADIRASSTEAVKYQLAPMCLLAS
jgi:hypothetical protein